MMQRMHHDDPVKTPTPPAKPRIPDNTVPHNVPPTPKPTDADPAPVPARPSFDRGDGEQPKTVRRDG